MLTILGGEWGGRKLKVPDRETLRPTSGRVKAAIFSIIESIQWKRSGAPDFSSWRCCDLYAGVGGLGLEVLSRGAKECVFVEKDRKHIQALEENIKNLNCVERCRTLFSDVQKMEWSKFSPFDLVLIDPPYRDSYLPELLRYLGSGTVLHKGGIVLFEHDPTVQFEEILGLTLHSERKLGPAGISVFIRNEG